MLSYLTGKCDSVKIPLCKCPGGVRTSTLFIKPAEIPHFPKEMLILFGYG